MTSKKRDGVKEIERIRKVTCHMICNDTICYDIRLEYNIHLTKDPAFSTAS